jgi:propionyl-CoA carboxylase alpha chain
MLALAATIIFHVRLVAVRDSLKPMTPQIGRDAAPKAEHVYKVRAENDVFDIRLIGSLSARNWVGFVNDRQFDIETPEFEFYRRRLKLKINGSTHRFRLQAAHPFMIGAFCGISRLFEIYTPREWELINHIPRQIEKAMEDVLVCPMPGLVVDLIIIESMKMESGVSSPCDGRVEEILVVQGQSVETGDILIRFTMANE